MDYEGEWDLLFDELRREYPHDPPEWIEDAVAETLGFTVLPSGLTAVQEHCYLLKTARRLLYREDRFHQRQPILDPRMDAMDNSTLTDQRNNEAREFIEWGLTQLPNRTASIIRQKRFDKIPLRVVAMELSMKTPSVQKIYSRGLKKLSEILSRELYRGGLPPPHPSPAKNVRGASDGVRRQRNRSKISVDQPSSIEKK